MDCGLPGFSVHGIFQARVLEWVAISFSRGSSLTQGSNPGLPHLQVDALPSKPPGKSEYIMWNAGLDEARAGSKTAGRNINNLRYADDTTLRAESKEEVKSLWKVKKESEETGLKLNIQKTKIMASGPITSWQTDGRNVESVSDFIFLGSKINVDSDCSHDMKRCLLLEKIAMTNLDSVLNSRDINFANKGPYSIKAMVFQ